MATATIDYTPVLDGEPYDPAEEGGSVSALHLYRDEQQTDLALTTGPAARVAPHRYRFSFQAPPDGVYYAVVEWRDAADNPPFIDRGEIVQFPLPTGPEPVPDGLVVGVDVVARTAGFPLPLSASARETIIDLIMDAQADVEAYLGQPISPVQKVATGLYPHPTGWALPEPGTVVSAAPEYDPAGLATGLYSVTYRTGLDAAHDAALRPIRRYVKAHAAALTRQDPVALTVKIARSIKSVNVQGQGITYGDEIGQAPGAVKVGSPGSEPTLVSLSRWRVAGRRVFQRAGASPGGWT